MVLIPVLEDQSALLSQLPQRCNTLAQSVVASRQYGLLPLKTQPRLHGRLDRLIVWFLGGETIGVYRSGMVSFSHTLFTV